MKLGGKLHRLVMRYKLPAFLVAVILVALALVLVSVKIYYNSGAFQLDLSRPEYQSVRSQINKDQKNLKSFDSQGEITDKVLDDFLKLYIEESDKVLQAKAFSNDVLSDEQLGL